VGVHLRRLHGVVPRRQVADEASSHRELTLSLGRQSVELSCRLEAPANDVAPHAVAHQNEETAGYQRADDLIAEPAQIGLALLFEAGEVDDGHLGRRCLADGREVDHGQPPYWCDAARLKFVADMLECSAGFVKPGSYNARMHFRSVQSVPMG